MKILYFGPIAESGKPALGGFEAANRKNIDKLRQLRIDVEEFSNPIINRKWGKLGKLAYISLYFKPFILAKYQTKGKGKQKRLRAMLSSADCITVESSSYIRDIKEVMGIDAKAIYFPNLTICDNLPIQTRSHDKFSIFYFGRITMSKGIDVLLDMMNYLDTHYHLYLAGNIDKDFDLNIVENENITYLGLLTPSQLKEEMGKMHFFVFPTRHIGEGQSNSLIESMANGLVPLASNQGFNAEVIADCGIVLDKNATGAEYATEIKKINMKLWERMSEKASTHIRTCHNIDIEIPKLVALYKRILKIDNG